MPLYQNRRKGLDPNLTSSSGKSARTPPTNRGVRMTTDKRVSGRGDPTKLYTETKRATGGLKPGAEMGSKLGENLQKGKKRRQAMKDLRNGGKKAEKISNKHVNARRAKSMPQGPKKHSVHTLRGR